MEVFFCIKFTPRKFVNSLLQYPKGKIINPKITFSIKNCTSENMTTVGFSGCKIKKGIKVTVNS